MSGHSHWATIKRKKGANDAKRGAVFTRMGREIAVAAREGADPDSNYKLRLVVDKARAQGMPKDNIERAVRRGAGLDKDAAAFEEGVFEGYGPHGVAMVVKVVTDNRNRTISDLRRIFTRAGGNLGENGSVAWQFDTLGYISAPREGRDDDKIFEMAIEAGAENYEADAEVIEFYTQPADLHTVSKNLQAVGIKPENVELIMKPKNPVSLEPKDAVTVMNCVEGLEDLEDVQNVYSALELSDEVMKQLEAQAA
ncbi:putative transcriptional regulatory protein [Thermoflexales bacterium]|nr:putative transcriptional regulatory protein [Thermoflexales bacterium]